MEHTRQRTGFGLGVRRACQLSGQDPIRRYRTVLVPDVVPDDRGQRSQTLGVLCALVESGRVGVVAGQTLASLQRCIHMATRSSTCDYAA